MQDADRTGRPSGSACFVVLTTQRNGSTWVMSVLNALDGVTAQGEIFLPRPRSREQRWDTGFAHPRYVESADRFGGRRPVAVWRYLHDFYDAEGAVGFKLMYSQVRAQPEILAFLVRHRIRVVHLVRRNHLDVLISYAVKRRIGRAHILTDADRPRDVRVALNTHTLVREVEWLERKHAVGRRVLKVLRLPHVEVAYEDLVADPRRFSSVLDFLGIASATAIPESHILRTRTGAQGDVVVNFDDVARTLSASRFAHLLDAA